MSKSIGASFDFYVENFSDMEALNSSKMMLHSDSITAADRMMAYRFLSNAKLQAASLLRSVATSLIETAKNQGCACERQDQRGTLTENWVVRVSLIDKQRRDAFAQAGFTLNVPEDGKGFLCFWLQGRSTRRATQRSLLKLLAARGRANAREAESSVWGRGVVIVDEYRLPKGSTVEECTSWVESIVSTQIVPAWPELIAALW